MLVSYGNETWAYRTNFLKQALKKIFLLALFVSFRIALPPLSSLSFFARKASTLAPAATTVDDQRTIRHVTTRKPAAALALLLTKQLQFLCMLSLVDYISTANYLFADFVVGLRYDRVVTQSCVSHCMLSRDSARLIPLLPWSTIQGLPLLQTIIRLPVIHRSRNLKARSLSVRSLSVFQFIYPTLLT